MSSVSKILAVLFPVLVIACAIIIPLIAHKTVVKTKVTDEPYQVPNRTLEPVEVTTSTVNQTEVPGAFESTVGMAVNLMSYGNRATTGLGESLRAQKAVAYNLSVEKILENVTYSDDGSTMTYHERPSYQWDNVTGSEDIIKTLNYPFLSLYYQMDNKPQFMYSWQTMAQVSSKMYSQNFQQFYYALNCYNSYFWNETDVLATVLDGLSMDAQSIVYNDTQYGMSSTAGLTAWMAAYDQSQGTPTGWKTEPMAVLTLYFARLNVTLTPAFFTQVLGTDSIIDLQITELEAKLVGARYFTDVSEITNVNLAARQWAQGDILNNQNLTIENSTDYKSMTSMNELGMNFILQPEIAASGCNADFTAAQGLGLLNQTDVGNNQMTLLNPINVQYFLNGVLDARVNPDTLKDRFGLTSQAQIECLYVYITTQGEVSRPLQAAGSSMARAIDVSLPIIQEHTAFELASRTMAAYNYKNSLTCATYFATVMNTTEAATFCTNVDFSDLYTLQQYVAYTWYNQDDCNSNYRHQWMEATGLTSSDYDAFYKTQGSDPTPFGKVLRLVNQQNYDWFNCEINLDFPANCSSIELGFRQWGSSEITYNPMIPNLRYTIPSLSIAEWGDYPNLEVPIAPEYFFYSQFYPNGTAPNLTYTQVLDITEGGYSWYGLNNSYNAKMLAHDVAEYRDQMPNQSEYLAGVEAQFGLSQTQIYAMVDVLMMHAGDFLFEGTLKEQTTMELVFGWTTDLVTKVAEYNNTAAMLAGDSIYLDPFVTPVLTTMSPAMKTQNVTISTGTGQDPDNLPGRVSHMNGLGYPNKKFWVWNGAELVETAVRCYGDFDSYKVFDGSLNKNDSVAEPAYVLDSYSLQNLELPYQNSSLICSNGTGSACDDDYNKQTTLIKGQSSKQFAEQDSCAFNLPLSGANTPSITIDNASGFSTAFSRGQHHTVNTAQFFGSSAPHPYKRLQTIMEDPSVGIFGDLTVSDVADVYNVSASAFVTTVYPQNGEITLHRNVTVSYNDEEVRVAWVVVLSIFGFLFTIAAIFFIIKCLKKDEGQDDERTQGVEESNDALLNTKDESQDTGR